MLKASILDYSDSPEEAAEVAKSKGFTPVWPTKRQITLDLDSPQDEINFAQMRAILFDIFGARVVDEWKSKAKGKHVLLEVDFDLTPIQRVAIQAACGSDRRRELFAVALILEGVDEPSVLFRPPQK